MSDSDRIRTETVGERLKRVRSERRLSQRALAVPGVSAAYISRIEAGEREPSVKALRKLAPRLGVSPEYLETGSELAGASERELRLVDAELELRLERDPAAAEAALSLLLEDALAAGDAETATRARIGLGMAAARTGRHAEAVSLLEEAVDSGLVSSVDRPDVYATLARVYGAEGRSDRAAEVLESALATLGEEAPGDVATRARFSTYLSYALADLGEVERAQEVLQEAIGGARHLSDPYTQIRLYWSLARLGALQGNYARALGYGRRAIALLEATEDSYQLGRAHLLCAGILNLEGRSEEALEHLAAAERLLAARAITDDLGSLRVEQARAAAQLGRGGEAVARAREALELLSEADPAERASALRSLGEGLSLEGDPVAAVEALRDAVELFLERDRRRDAAETCRAWGRALRAAGRESEALDVLERAADLAVEGVSQSA